MKRQAHSPIGVGTVTISPRAKEYIGRVVETGRISYGPFTQRFERQFGRIHSISHAIFCNSGTSALTLALAILKKKHGWRDGDEVLVPALTFVTSVNVILQNNLTPVFVDVDPVYFSIHPAEIERHISKKTRAIMVVHIGGLPADMDPIMKLADTYKLTVIEDSCETMFARYRGRSVGTFGEVSCFSTHAAHQLATGIGGFLCTDNSALALQARSLISHGRDPRYLSIDDSKKKRTDELRKVIASRLNFPNIGFNYRATEFEAALGLAQLKNWKTMVAKRKRNAMLLSRGLKSLERVLQLPSPRPGTEHTFMFYPIIIKDPAMRRDRLVVFLEQHGIETRYLLPLLSQPIYKARFGAMEDHYPVAKYLTHHGFYIGCHQGLDRGDIDYIVGVFSQFFAH
ncbi:DegT/DnrJ/EryC1/StrS family aminotransferase [Candidatus Gottesmanbacteria bacterium]|nr:DegT/DnrJ/EryC1/StrS family aminotransferase [Candidatus Gottesmanbacteria bacterium]